jgi:hypothetical protein
VAESRLSQLPSTKVKGDSNAQVKTDVPSSAPKDKGAPKKGDKKGDKKAASHGAKDQTSAPVDSSTYEVLSQCKGSDLVGQKYGITTNFPSNLYSLHIGHVVHF